MNQTNSDELQWLEVSRDPWSTLPVWEIHGIDYIWVSHRLRFQRQPQSKPKPSFWRRSRGYKYQSSRTLPCRATDASGRYWMTPSRSCSQSQETRHCCDPRLRAAQDCYERIRGALIWAVRTLQNCSPHFFFFFQPLLTNLHLIFAGRCRPPMRRR